MYKYCDQYLVLFLFCKKYLLMFLFLHLDFLFVLWMFTFTILRMREDTI